MVGLASPHQEGLITSLSLPWHFCYKSWDALWFQVPWSKLPLCLSFLHPNCKVLMTQTDFISSLFPPVEGFMQRTFSALMC